MNSSDSPSPCRCSCCFPPGNRRVPDWRGSFAASRCRDSESGEQVFGCQTKAEAGAESLRRAYNNKTNGEGIAHFVREWCRCNRAVTACCDSKHADDQAKCEPDRRKQGHSRCRRGNEGAELRQDQIARCDLRRSHPRPATSIPIPKRTGVATRGYPAR